MTDSVVGHLLWSVGKLDAEPSPLLLDAVGYNLVARYVQHFTRYLKAGNIELKRCVHLEMKRCISQVNHIAYPVVGNNSHFH